MGLLQFIFNDSFPTVTTIAGTLGTNVVVGNTLVALVNSDSASGVTRTVTDNINGSWPAAKYTFTAPGDEQLDVFVLTRALPGATTVTAHFSGGGSDAVGICAFELSGQKVYDGALGAVQTNPGSGADGMTSGNVTPTSSADLLVGYAFAAVGTGFSATPVKGTGFTLVGSGILWASVINNNRATLETKLLANKTPVAATGQANPGTNGPYLTLAVLFKFPPSDSMFFGAGTTS